MTISSRTPEGHSNHCPVCNKPVRIEPSRPFGDAPCPNCGALLWFVSVDSDALFYDSADPVLAELFIERFGVGIESLRTGGIDSLDLVEWIMELEDRR